MKTPPQNGNGVRIDCKPLEFSVRDTPVKNSRSVKLADAHVEAWHAASENSTAPGGTFYSKGSFTLTRSRLTATWIVSKCFIRSQDLQDLVSVMFFGHVYSFEPVPKLHVAR